MQKRNDLDIAAIVSEYQSGASAASIAKKNKTSPWTILSRLRKAGICIRSNKQQNEKRLNLDKDSYYTLIEIIDGILLGDGSLDKRKGFLRIEQASARYGWLYHIKHNLLKLGASSSLTDITIKNNKYIDNRRINTGESKVLYTPCYVEIQEQIKRWYPYDKKIIPHDVLITPLSVAYWFCGDGSYQKDGNLMFYTNSFSENEVIFLANKFNNFNVRAKCVPHRKNEFIIKITKRNDAYKLKKLIEPYIPECCMYKLQHVRPKLSSKEFSKSHRKLTDTQIEQIKFARNRGTTMPLLAKQFNVSVTTLYKALKT